MSAPAVAASAPVVAASAPPPSPTATVASAPPTESARAEPATTAPVPPPPADEGPSRSQKPLDIMTARDAAFLIDYANSDVKARAQAACAKELDAERNRACEEKARDAFQGDVIRFKRGPDDKKDWAKTVSLVIYKRNGSALREVSVGTVELSEEGADGVRVKLGKQKGARPLWRGQSSALIKAPNDYSIEFDDPEYGHLRYDAKIGLVTD
ncbi:MAG TPA: hypothetical protein VLJ38_02690 [Polyangiaceae bacterium]|nr:hypothetical protein [Polyangiaceae bacterium]